MPSSAALSPETLGYNYLALINSLDSAPSPQAPPTPPLSTLNTSPYFIATRYNTPISAFDKFIQELDGSIGKAERKSYRQTYRTRLTGEQADGIRKRWVLVLILYLRMCGRVGMGRMSEESGLKGCVVTDRGRKLV
jgi:hypothetical protein